MAEPHGKSTNVDYLATLPYDVISEMVSRMGISTVDSLKREISYKWNYENPDENKYKGVSDACDNRKSVVKYLNKHFGDGVALLEAMSKYYVYISGSRSLDFFEEGYIDDDSDWDIYVSNWPGHVFGIMKELEKLGVAWMSPKDEIEDLKQMGTGSLVVESSKMDYLLRNNTFSMGDMDADELADRVRFANIVNFTIRLEEGTSSVQPNEAGDGYTSNTMTCIIRGKLVYKGKETRIQLICESRDNSNASIVAPLTYHSSCVQSFIGPYTACHMYGRLTSEGKSYGWRNNISTSARNRLSERTQFGDVEVQLVPGWSKYTDRGFSYVNPPEWSLGFELRNAEDGLSTWLEYKDHTAAPHDVVMLYTQVSKALTWFQVTDGTVPVRFPIKATHSHNRLEFESWFNTDDAVTGDMREHFGRYIPHLKYEWRGDMMHLSHLRDL